MDMKKVIILGLSLVVLVLAAVFLLGRTEKPVVQEPAGRLVMTTDTIEVVEGVPNYVRVYFKNIGKDVKNVRVEIPRRRTCDGECETPDPRYDAVPSSGTLYMDDVLITNEEDSFRFVLTPWGVDGFAVPIKVSYTTDEYGSSDCSGTSCKTETQEFLLNVRVTDGLVLETKSVPFVVDEKNTISLKFRNVGRTEIRNIRVRVEGTRTAFAFTERCFSAESGYDGEESVVLEGGESTTISFDVTSDKKPDVLRVEVTYNFLDRELTKVFEVPVR